MYLLFTTYYIEQEKASCVIASKGSCHRIIIVLLADHHQDIPSIPNKEAAPVIITTTKTKTRCRMCRLIVVATIASCYYCVSQWMMHGVHAQQQDTSTLAYPQRNRYTYNKDTSIRMDAQALDEIWEREAALAQAEAERLLMGDYNNDMSIVPTPAPVRLPTMAPSIICTENTKEEYLVGVLGSITPEVTLLDPTTPQGQAFEFVLENDPCNYPVIDARYALASLFYSTNGTQWVNSEGWLTEASECDWFGVSCNDGVFTTNITLRT